MNTASSDSSPCKKGFTLREKVFAQLTFQGMGWAGAVAIALKDLLFGVLYLLFAYITVIFIVMRYITCPRCDQLRQHSDCLQLPVFFTKRVIAGYKDEPFTLKETIIFLSIFGGMIIVPQYWLIQAPILFVIFWVFCLLWYAGQFFYFCKTCNVESCPFYRISAHI
ncbi:MAG: hypothetical protein ACXACI_18735 [Candidatus Hodarchaeales archaeon]|jgi:hypothetical protein